MTTSHITPQITPNITRLPLPDPRATSDHSCIEVATIGEGRIVGHVWRNAWREGGTLHVEFDATLDGIADASGAGLGGDPQRLRDLAAVAWATAGELGEARARDRHPAGKQRTRA